MDKKGQFYIFASIVLSTVIFFTVINRIVLQDADKEFNYVYENYIYEANKVINNAVFSQSNISNQFSNYTLDFIEYIKSKNSDMGISYMLIFQNDIRIVNYLNGPIYYNRQYLIEKSDQRLFRNAGNFSIVYNNRTYYYGLDSSESIQFKALVEKS